MVTANWGLGCEKEEEEEEEEGFNRWSSHIFDRTSCTYRSGNFRLQAVEESFGRSPVLLRAAVCSRGGSFGFDFAHFTKFPGVQTLHRETLQAARKACNSWKGVGYCRGRVLKLWRRRMGNQWEPPSYQLLGFHIFLHQGSMWPFYHSSVASSNNADALNEYNY